MKRIIQLTTLVVILSVTWLPIAQGQDSDAWRFRINSATDLMQLHAEAEKGDPDAQYQLAEKYRIGFPLEQDHKKALDLYSRSAEQGFPSSQFRLGELHEKGEVLEQDLRKSFEFYRQAAEQGHREAQHTLAQIYHLGRGVEEDIAAAIVWYRKAALQGDEWSQLALGDQYRIGKAVPKDLAQSTRWYRMAAEQGNIFAQYELGNAYKYGNGVERNIEQSIEWYQRSAEAGNLSAKLALTELDAGDAGPVKLTASVSTALQRPQIESTAQSVPSASLNSLTSPDAESAFATTQSVREEEAVSQLLALAEQQVARLALTTPEGDNAYDTYQLVLTLQPENKAALGGIEQIVIKYIELSELAAKRGKREKSKQYAAKAAILAPEHPLVLSMTFPIGVERSGTEEANTRSFDEIKKQQVAPAERQDVATEVRVAAVNPTPSTLQDLIESPDDLVFEPFDYRDRQVVVTGSVVYLFWEYRLRAETGQNSIVINVDRLDQADRTRLNAAIERAGFLGQVRARIEGRVSQQTPVTFELVATELTLIGIIPSEDETQGTGLDSGFDRVAPSAATGNHKFPLGNPVSHEPVPASATNCYQELAGRRPPGDRVQTGTRTRCY